MAKMSAGLLLYRRGGEGYEVLIGHPGGPFWARKDEAAWSIPKGEYTDEEDPWVAAQREFVEELGLPVPDGPRVALPPVKQSGGKIVTAFAVEANLDVTDAVSNTFEMEWPKGSGVVKEFPELDRVAWFPVEQAQVKLLKGQRPLLGHLVAHLEGA
ncbi:NUDIX domain-containing protein [Mycobacterium yunnanensis]|uniref:NUDIX domain-containing protein n=1 Tax=Mycobacterium yunnanensis TaxID=368477 RepID=A0A9X2Z0K1_9MYCO|nr:NUDIX domain-containing protein [Mycobacterium yunnanensis]MCV7420047.1 NUDIX domain-containing protein [Mycobacterium yunnanensis]